MSILQNEYASIGAQLHGFLASKDLAGAIVCITSPKLREHIKEIDDKWTVLLDIAEDTLKRLKGVVKTMRERLFCGDGHIFYIQVRNKDREGVGEYLYPVKNKENTFEYVVTDETVYFVDIKDLSGRQYTPNLYTYEIDGSRVTEFPNPFNLTNPRPRDHGETSSRGGSTKYLAFGVRMYAFSLDEEDHTLELNLKNDTNKIVLSMRFVYAIADTRGSVNFMLNALLQTCL